MADEKREKLPLLTTPPGRCKSYATVQTPDEKYDTYHIKLYWEQDDEGYEWAQEMVEKIDALTVEASAAAKAAFKPTKDKKKFVEKFMEKPYSVDEDTGTITINFKKAGSFKKGPQKIVTPLSLALFDAKGNKIPTTTELKVGEGSTFKLSFTMEGFVKPLGASVSIRLVAAKLLNLVEWEAGGDADAYGLGGEEDGYEVDAVSEEDKAEAEAAGIDQKEEDEVPSQEDLDAAAEKAAALAKKGAKLADPYKDKPKAAAPAKKAEPVKAAPAKSAKAAPKKVDEGEDSGDF